MKRHCIPSSKIWFIPEAMSVEDTWFVVFNAFMISHYFRCMVAIRKGVLLMVSCSL